MIDHSQAVEVAKRQVTDAQFEDIQRLMPVVMVPLSDGSWQMESSKSRLESANRIRDYIDSILSAPGPSRDAATAEKCREFVCRVADGFRSPQRIEGNRYVAMIDEFTAELLAMFAGGTGDDDPDADTPTTILQGLIDDLQVPNSLGVSGSDFTTCLGCNGGSYPGRDGYVHGKGCPVEKAETALAALGTPTEPAK